MDIHRDWGWASDYVEATHRILQQPEPEDFVIATGETRSLAGFTAEAFANFGLDWKEHTISDATLFRPTDIVKSCPDAVKAREKMLWIATHLFKDVMQRLVEQKPAIRARGKED